MEEYNKPNKGAYILLTVLLILAISWPFLALKIVYQNGHIEQLQHELQECQEK